jgi:hypothetical protein
MDLLPAIRGRVVLVLCCCLVAMCDADPSVAQQISGIQSVTQRAFVTSVTPVFGPRGFVGGVSVDAKGVVSRPSVDVQGDLNGKWKDSLRGITESLTHPAAIRFVSLRKIDEHMAGLVQRGEPLAAEVFFLAGLQRVEYVFVDHEHRDIVLAGPAEGWRIADGGEVVGITTGRPVVRLDDLIDALRTADVSRTSAISCSIEPTAAGLQRYARLLNSRRLQFSPATVRAIEQAMGPQQVLITGVPHDSHYARVMVAADYIMKLLAMGIEPSPVDELPSYLEMLRRRPPEPQIASPRWWMTVDYEPLLHSPDLHAWQIRGPGLKTLTADSFLDAQGRRTAAERPNPVAERWAVSMTENFPRLVAKYPVFGQLRNCVDMSVVAALISKRDLLTAADCPLDFLLDDSRLKGASLEVPKSVDSQASFVRARRGWIVSVSGGVELDPWSVVEDVRQLDTLEEVQERSVIRRIDHWWWE